MTQRMSVFLVLICAVIVLSLQVFVSAGRDDTSTVFNRMDMATSTPAPSCPDGDSNQNIIYCDTAPEWSITPITDDDTLQAYEGDDQVYIMNYASGGHDDVMPIDGGDDNDTLIFQLFVDDWYVYQAMTDDINAADPANGSLYNPLFGQTYQWTNFETLVADLQYTGDPTMTPSPVWTEDPPACVDGIYMINCNIAPEFGGNNNDILEVNGPEDTWVYIQEGADGGEHPAHLWQHRL